MSTALDLASLAAQGELKIPIARGVVSQGGSGTDYTGWSGVSSVFVEAKVEVREQSRGFATLTLTVEGSSNGSDWSTLETFNFGHGGTQSATVSSPPDHLRVSWTVGGGSEWQIIEVTAAPSVIDFTTDGGSQPMLVSGPVTLSSADILALNATTYSGPAFAPTPAAGQMIVPLSILTVSHFVTTAYANTGSNEPYVSTAAEYTSPNGGSWFKVARAGGLSLERDSAVISGPSLFDDDVSIAGVDGQPLGWFVNSPYTDGDGSLDVTTFYYLADIS